MSKYDDIINLPHPKSKTHNSMSNYDRAAQFAPFAALSGHRDSIDEEGRLTTERIIPDESLKEEINAVLSRLNDVIKSRPEARILYFESDLYKSGGRYVTVTEKIAEIDPILKLVVTVSGKNIPMDDILDIEKIS